MEYVFSLFHGNESKGRDQRSLKLQGPISRYTTKEKKGARLNSGPGNVFRSVASHRHYAANQGVL